MRSQQSLAAPSKTFLPTRLDTTHTHDNKHPRPAKHVVAGERDTSSGATTSRNKVARVTSVLRRQSMPGSSDSTRLTRCSQHRAPHHVTRQRRTTLASAVDLARNSTHHKYCCTVIVVSVRKHITVSIEPVSTHSVVAR